MLCEFLSRGRAVRPGHRRWGLFCGVKWLLTARADEAITVSSMCFRLCTLSIVLRLLRARGTAEEIEVDLERRICRPDLGFRRRSSTLDDCAMLDNGAKPTDDNQPRNHVLAESRCSIAIQGSASGMSITTPDDRPLAEVTSQVARDRAYPHAILSCL